MKGEILRGLDAFDQFFSHTKLWSVHTSCPVLFFVVFVVCLLLLFFVCLVCVYVCVCVCVCVIRGIHMSVCVDVHACACR